MALISTPSAANANSYLSVAEADAIAAEHPFASAWSGYVTSKKESLLIMATRVLDKVCFVGIASSSTQSLAFPRTGLFNRNGFALASDSIPSEVKFATFELALMLGVSDVTRESEASTQGLKRVKAGPVELEFRDLISLKTLPDNVLSLLVPSWLCPDPATKYIEFKVL